MITCIYILIIYHFEQYKISTIPNGSASTDASDTPPNSPSILQSSSLPITPSHPSPSNSTTTPPTVNPISLIHSQSPSQYQTTSTAPTETPLLSTTIKYSYPTNFPSISKPETQNGSNLSIIMMLSMLITLTIIFSIYKMVRRKYKNKANDDNGKKRENEVNDNDKDADNDKDEGLYIEYNHTRGQENDLEGVSEKFEGAYNKEMRKQHNGELHAGENIDSEGNEAPFTDITTTKYDEKNDPGFV